VNKGVNILPGAQSFNPGAKFTLGVMRISWPQHKTLLDEVSKMVLFFSSGCSLHEKQPFDARLSVRRNLIHSQGDQIERIFASWETVFLGQRPLVPLLLLGPPFFSDYLFFFGSTTLLTRMTGISLHTQWPQFGRLFTLGGFCEICISSISNWATFFYGIGKLCINYILQKMDSAAF
jgi:hypothetical protein